MSQLAGRVVIYGGKGALGATVVSHFKCKNWWVASIDLNQNQEADVNILVGKDDPLEKQQATVSSGVGSALGDNKLDAIICVAGGWAGGNAKKDLIKNSDLMWRQSVWSSLISAEIAANYLKDGGLLSLTGAKAALEPTPGMVGYGMAKAAVHHLVQSLSGKESGMPENSTTLAILPITLDTPMNRKWMPKADFSTWTPLEYLAETFMDWSTGKNRPKNGSLVQLVTTNSTTKLVPV